METLARIVQSPINVDCDISSRAVLSIGNKNFEGDGHVTASRNGIDLSIKMDLKRYLDASADASGFVTKPLGRPTEYGKLIDQEHVGTARSLEVPATWTADQVYSNGVGTQSVGSQHFSIVTASISRLNIRYQPESEVAFLRQVYEGGYLSFSATFAGKKVVVASQELPTPESATLAVAVAGAELSQADGEALWLWLSFLSGSRLRAISDETYGQQGQLLSRSIQLGGSPSKTPVPPIPFHLLTDAQATIIGEGIRRMVASGFPIEIILDYLHTSADAIQMEMQMMLLLIGIHASAEAWAQLPGGSRGKHNSKLQVLDKGFEDVRDELTRAVKPLSDHLPPQIVESVVNFINSANYTSMNTRVNALFADLGLDVTEEKYALKLRNPLVHSGYIHRSLMDLDPKSQQEHVDAIGHLRNVLNQIVLSLCGYTGEAVEYTRNWTFPVVAKPGPFNDIS